MGLRINNNIAAMNAYRNLSATDNAMAKSLEKLSSGFRINRAADDAAGLSISEGLRSQIGGLKQAVRNAQDGVNVVQTADGALTEVHAILQRMRDLAVQSANTGSSDATAQQAAQTEFGQLSQELDRIGSTTSFGNSKLLDGTFGGGTGATATGTATALPGTAAGAATDTVTLTINGVAGTAIKLANTGGVTYSNDAAGAALLQTNLNKDLAGTGVTASVSFSSAKATVSYSTAWDGTAGDSLSVATSSTALALASTSAANSVANVSQVKTFQVGANNTNSDQISVSILAVTSTSLGLGSLTLVGNDAAGKANAAAAISTIDSAISSVSTQRANLGAYQNRFEHTVNNLNVAVQNLTASESQIRDTDMAQEMTNFTRNQILSQAGTAMLAQANQASQGVLQLLRG